MNPPFREERDFVVRRKCGAVEMTRVAIADVESAAAEILVPERAAAVGDERFGVRGGYQHEALGAAGELQGDPAPGALIRQFPYCHILLP